MDVMTTNTNHALTDRISNVLRCVAGAAAAELLDQSGLICTKQEGSSGYWDRHDLAEMALIEAGLCPLGAMPYSARKVASAVNFWARRRLMPVMVNG